MVKPFCRTYWQRATNDPDLIYLAPCMIAMGLIMPLVFRVLAAVVMPLGVGIGSLLFLVAVAQK